MRTCGFHIAAYKEYALINLSESTVRNYIFSLRHFITFIQKHPANITEEDVENYILLMIKKGLSSTFINARVTAVSSYFTYLRKKKIFVLPFDVLETTKRPKVIIREQRVCRHEEISLFIQKINEDEKTSEFIKTRDVLIILIASTTGARINEIRNLKIV